MFLSSDEDDAAHTTMVVRSRATVSKFCNKELEDVDFSQLSDGHQPVILRILVTASLMSIHYYLPISISVVRLQVANFQDVLS